MLRHEQSAFKFKYKKLFDPYNPIFFIIVPSSFKLVFDANRFHGDAAMLLLQFFMKKQATATFKS